MLKIFQMVYVSPGLDQYPDSQALGLFQIKLKEVKYIKKIKNLFKTITGTSNTEPRAVTAHIGQHTRPTSTMRQPLPATSPVPEGLMVMQDHQAVFGYDPGKCRLRMFP